MPERINIAWLHLRDRDSDLPWQAEQGPRGIVLPVTYLEQNGRMVTFAITPPSTQESRAGATQPLDYQSIPDRYVRRIEWADRPAWARHGIASDLV